MNRSSVIKPGRPELKSAPTTPPRSTPVPLPTSTPSCAPPGGRNRCRRAAAALHRPRIAAAAEEVDDQSVAVQPPSLSLFFPYPSATLHRHRMLTIAPFRAQDRRQDLAVDLRCPRRRSCSPPTDPTTPAPTTPPPTNPSTPPPIPTLAADQNLPEVSEPTTTVPPVRWRHRFEVIVDLIESGPLDLDPTAAYRFGRFLKTAKSGKTD